MYFGLATHNGLEFSKQQLNELCKEIESNSAAFCTKFDMYVSQSSNNIIFNFLLLLVKFCDGKVAI